MIRRFYATSLALFAVFAPGAVAAGSASAAEVAQWLVNGATIALGAKVDVDVSGEVLAEDMSQKIDLFCLGLTGLGFALANGEDEFVEGQCGTVDVDEGTCGSAVIVPVDLPWHTQLTEMEPGNIFLDAITEGTGGSPGWLAECTILGIKVDDTCTDNRGTTRIANEVGEEVDALFETANAEEEATCKIGSSETVSGLFEGLILLKALNEAGTELLPLAVSLTAEVI